MAELIKVSITGTMPGGEVWSVNPVWKILTGAAISFAECTAIAAAVNAITIPATVKALWTPSVSVKGCRVEARTAAGVLESLAEGLRGAPVVGTGSHAMPFQTSLVSTLRTTTAGGSGRGRLYWPAVGVAMDATSLRLFGTGAADAAAGIKSYLALLNTAVDANVDEDVALAVWSRTNASLALVNSISVGDVLDTQRRRRDKVVETISTVAYP